MSKNLIEDAELVIRAKKGNESAFKRLVQKYHKSVYYMQMRYVFNHDDAEDLTQEAFTKAFKSLDKYNPEYAFSTWLFRIATNHAIDFLRKKRLKLVSIDNPYQNDDGDSMSFDIKDESLNPNERMLKTERGEIVNIAVNQLGVKYRKLIELRYFKELSYDEIAKELELPLGTVKAQLHRARFLLENLLEKIKNDM